MKVEHSTNVPVATLGELSDAARDLIDQGAPRDAKVVALRPDNRRRDAQSRLQVTWTTETPERDQTEAGRPAAEQKPPVPGPPRPPVPGGPGPVG